MSKNLQFDRFIDLLKRLDDVLVEKDIQLERKAIGGFAMIYWAKQYKQSGRSSSRDIDSLSVLSEEVKKIVALIGQNEGAEEDWLNNDWLEIKKGNEELEYFADWQLIDDQGFNNIKLYVLDLETLFFFKMRAIDEKLDGASEPPRTQDVRDIYLILKIFCEYDINNIKNEKMRKCVRYFPQARDFMSGREPEKD